MSKAIINLLGALALAVDVGYLLAERRQMQSAADAAALAAAHGVLISDSDAEVVAAAEDYGALNAGDDANVVVDRPPVSGRHAGDDNFIQITVTTDVQRFFVGAVYSGPWQAQASAVAGIEPIEADAALLALNPDSGGLESSGNSSIDVINGSVVSNFDLDLSGNTHITADRFINANDGFELSGNTTLEAGLGENPRAPEVPDPLLDKISPPPLPAVPDEPNPSGTPSAATCGTFSSGTVPAGAYAGGGPNCIDIKAVTTSVTLASGQYHFDRQSGITINGNNPGQVVLAGGSYVFDESRISVGGNTDEFEMQSGTYSFLDGGLIDISNVPNAIIGGGELYFSGDNSGIYANGNNNVTLGPGEYVFDGGRGVDISGNTDLHFEAGEFVFWFNDGADLRLSGNGRITNSPGAHVRMYFYGAQSNQSDFVTSGNMAFSIPSGEYYFDQGRFLNSGNQLIQGEDIFLYFTGGGYLESTGNSSFAFTAPRTVVYPGYYPGVFMYSDHSNTATFTWNGNTAAVSEGAVYLPSSKLRMSGNSNGKVLVGPLIADSFEMSGNHATTIEFDEVVATDIPAVWLVE